MYLHLRAICLFHLFISKIEVRKEELQDLVQKFIIKYL